MKTPHDPAAGLAADTPNPSVRQDRFARLDGQSQRKRPLMRKYEIAHLTPDNDIHETSRLAPAMPAFEDAFAAIGRGAIVQTDFGPCAVEDLFPGNMVHTASHGPQRLLWKGSIVLVPGAQNSRPEMGSMTRITADALGLGRPAPDLVLGPAARLLQRRAALAQLLPHLAQQLRLRPALHAPLLDRQQREHLPELQRKPRLGCVVWRLPKQQRGREGPGEQG